MSEKISLDSSVIIHILKVQSASRTPLCFRLLTKLLYFDERKRTFFLVIFRELRKGSYQKDGFSYRLSYLIDKKEYRKGKIIGRKDCRFKK